MGGVVIRNHNVAPQLLDYLGRREERFTDCDPGILDALRRHGRGEVDEDAFWEVYKKATGDPLPPVQGSLLGRFFSPVLDGPTIAVLEELKRKGMRVVCGTNVIDAHYHIHQKNGDYGIFDKVYPSHLMKISKPDQDFYRYILDAEDVLPGEAFFTDDSEQNVQAACQVGLNSFLYSDSHELRRQLASLELGGRKQ